MTPKSEDERPVGAAVLDAAIAWQLRLDGGTPDPAEREALQQWLAADAEHRRAWRQLGQLDELLAPVRQRPALRRALLKPAATRGARRALAQGASALGLALAIGLGLAVTERFMPLQASLADLRTGTGERRTLTLDDGSELQLNTRSAVDLAFDEQQRALRLRLGEIHLRSGHPAGEQRPLLVLTPEGSLRALGTRFLVRRDAEQGTTRLTVLESAVLVRPPGCPPAAAAPCPAELRVQAGETVLLRAGGEIGEPQPAAPEADAWRDGVLVFDDIPLAEALAEIGRHRVGRLEMDPALAGLRVSATLPLADTDRALQALAAALPVELQRPLPWTLRLVPRQRP